MTMKNEVISQPEKLVSFADITPQPPSYFWEPYLIRDNLNYIYGAGGSGKTMLIMALFAAFTSGKMPGGMPGQLSCEPGNVIYFGAEDDAENYRYRLDLCGCDASKIFTVQPIDMPGLQSTDTIASLISAKQARLIVFDPVQSFLPAGADMNATSDIRPLMEGLRAVCRKAGCTALIVGHSNKNEKARAENRASGSMDLINASRSALIVGYHPDKAGVRAVAQTKSNAAWGDSFQFIIDQTGRFTWDGNCDLSPEAISNASRIKAPTAPSTDPVLLLVQALMRTYPSGWQGTTAELLEVGNELHVDMSLIKNARGLGKRLESIKNDLFASGILWTSSKKEHGKVNSFTLSKSLTK